MNEKTYQNRCEGWTRHGGALSLGPPEWRQCKEEGIVMLTVKQDDGEVQTLPACAACWQKVIDHETEILKAEPIQREAPSG